MEFFTPTGLSSTPGLANYDGHEFQRDFAVEFGVLSFRGNAHSTAAQFFDDFVMRDCLPNHRFPRIGFT